MPSGGVRKGAGRPKGAITKKTRELQEKALEGGLTPLEYMLQVLRDKEESSERRMWASEKAAPYVHARLQAVEHSGNVTLNHEQALDDLE